MPSCSDYTTSFSLLLKRWWLLGSVALGVGIVLKPILTLLGFAAISIFVCMFLFPQVVIPFLLIIRSSLDIFTDIGFYIGPMLINVPSITSLFLIFGGGLYLLFNVAVKKELIIDRIAKVFLFWLIALLFWVIIAYINFGLEGLIALREWIRLASLFIIYLLTTYLTKKVGYQKVINYVFMALPIPLVAGIYQIFTKSGLQVRGISRIYGTIAHPNTLALFLVLFIGLTLWKIQTAKRRFPWMALLALESIVLINTYSIGGIIMTATMLFVLILSRLKKRSRIAIFLLLIVLSFSFCFSPYGQERVRELAKTGSFEQIIAAKDISEYSSLSWRILNWYILLQEFSKRPVLGYGLQTTAELVNPWKADSHNDYVRFLVETGLIGLLFFLLFLYIVGKELLEAYRRSQAKDPIYSSLALTTFALYIAWIIGSLAGNHISGTTYQYYLWALFALVAAGPKS